MNFVNKYNKYKSKYILLKNKIGGKEIKNTIKTLNGPVAVAYLYNEELKKKIIILGDIHGNMDSWVSARLTCL